MATSRAPSVFRGRHAREDKAMPYKSEKQRRTMQAAANNPRFARKVGIAVVDAQRFVRHAEKKRKK